LIHIEFSLSKINDHNIYAQSWIPESATKGIIALVHGLGEHSGRYRHVADFFTKRGFGLIAFDLYGHGKSEGKRGFLPSENTHLVCIDKLLDYIKKEYPDKPIILYGHSLGGELVLWYSLIRKPKIKGVISTSPLFSTYEPVNPIKILTAQLMSKIAPSFTMDSGLNRNALSQDDSVIYTYNNDPLVHGNLSASLGWTMLEKGKWILDQGEKFALPLLLMVGSMEKIVSIEKIEEFTKKVPKNHITYKVWDGLYHELHNEPQKHLVLGFELDWMKQHVN